jgi:dTDP-3-amino-3,4,6-trideoxy-alpha-D-glucose transaminase
LNIPFNNLEPLYRSLRGDINTAVQRVISSGWYILGPEVEAFENAFAVYHGARYAVGVANGTDAIELALCAAGIGRGDEVITVAHTAVATVCAIERASATPVLVDIDPVTYTMNPAAVLSAITPRTRAIIPVHIYGHMADMKPISDIASANNLLLIEDCAQAHGAAYKGKLAGTFGDMATFSFYPTKNLGALGDGGAIITNNAYYAEKLQRLRNYGQTTRYNHLERGINSRLDEIQAAILSVKLGWLNKHNETRRELANRYNQLLADSVITPKERDEVYHVYHLYVIRHPLRDQIMQKLMEQGIGSLIHYPVPIHLQPAYKNLNYELGSLPVTEEIAKEIVSLPMYIGLTQADINGIVNEIQRSLQ